MNETECKYWSFDGGNSQRGICAIDNKFCDCLVGERDCYYKQLKRCEQKLDKIKEVVEIYRENCKIEGNCLDKRLCSTCYFGGGLEVCDDILDIIEGAENEQNC